MFILILGELGLMVAWIGELGRMAGWMKDSRLG